MTSPASSSLDGNQSLTILVDTSQKDGRLLLVGQDHKVLSSSNWTHPKRHTEELQVEFKNIRHLLSKSNLQKIVFISGPGSFTGLRVGAAFIKSLGLFYKDCPIYCINSFKITASHVGRNFPEFKKFSICISSIGKMVFRADYELFEHAPQKEKIYSEGAINYNPSENKVFSPNTELNKKFNDIAHVKLEILDYLNALKDLDQNIASSKIYSHLDLYPLYLRKSEAEEKYSYDKVKL